MSPSFIQSSRFAIYACVVFGLFAGVSGRLFYLHVLNQESARRVIAENRYRFQKLEPRRGVIFDREGNVLASSKPSWNIGVDPLTVDARDREKLPYLAMVLNVSVEELNQKFGWDYQSSGKPSRRRWVELAESVDESVHKAVDRLDIKGVYGNRYYSRYYPSKQDAAHVIGFINKADTPVMGVEHTLDFYLRGSAGWRVREVNGSRREIRQFRVRDVTPQNGYHLQLTLDSGIQRVVEKELDRIFEELTPESACIIVSDSQSGAVLAMGSRPTFDPNQFWKYDLNVNFRNRAISDIYEPGSVFKVVTAAGYINEGLGTRQTRFNCATPAVYHRNRRVVLPRDTRERGVMEFHDIIRKSSNRGTALAGFKLGEERLYDYCRAFGFGQKTGIELNGEESGILHSVDQWDHYTLSRLAIGYSVGVTPLQMHMAMSAVANDGKLAQPHVVDFALDEYMKPVFRFQNSDPKPVISAHAAREIRDCLIEAVSLSGTGSRAALDNIEIAGKTGTSRKLLEDGYSEDRHVGSFSGFFPARSPEYVVTVVVNDPQSAPSTYGGRVAAPAFRAIAEYIVSSRGLSPAPAKPPLMAWNES